MIDQPILGVFLVFLVSQTQGQLMPPTPPLPGHVSIFEDVAPLECTAIIHEVGPMSGVVGDRYRWKEFNVFPDEAFNDAERRAINDAMYTVSQAVPCINFGIWQRGSKPTGDYVHITRANTGCWSYVGRLGGAQKMNLQSPGCMGVGTIMHEIIHALGFDHEHNRQDRDDFINIHWENIEPEYHFAFQKTWAYRETFGVPYDLESIMHYESNAFSRNGKPTITTKSGGRLGRTTELRESDKKKLKLMYKC